MNRIKFKKTKNPSPKQLSIMAYNLKELYGGGAKVSIEAWAFTTGDTDIEYGIVAKTVHKYTTWSDLQDGYLFLMDAQDGDDV